jgi:hypothetical protein
MMWAMIVSAGVPGTGSWIFSVGFVASLTLTRVRFLLDARATQTTVSHG